MQEQTRFVANDGSEFTTKEACLEWEKVCHGLEDLRHWLGDGQQMPSAFEDVRDVFDDSLDFGHREWFEILGYESYMNENMADKKLWYRHLTRLKYLSNYIFYGAVNPI